MVSKTRYFWGLTSLVQNTRVGVPDVGHTVLTGPMKSLPAVCALALEAGLLTRQRFCLLYLLNVLLLSLVEGAVQLVFHSFSVGMSSYLTTDLMCLWGQVSTGSFYAALLDCPTVSHFMISESITDRKDHSSDHLIISYPTSYLIYHTCILFALSDISFSGCWTLNWIIVFSINSLG